jgi:hypothetical protein
MIPLEQNLMWKVLEQNPEQVSPTGVRQREQNILDATMPHK